MLHEGHARDVKFGVVDFDTVSCILNTVDHFLNVNLHQIEGYH